MKKILFLFAITVTSLVLFACTPQGGTSQNGPSKYAAIAQCLTQKGVKFYGAFWCPHCAEQKKVFGSDMQYITYVECDPKGKDAKPEECQKAGVERYPTWFFPGQGIITGVQQPEDLAAKANCSIGAVTPPTSPQPTSQTPTQENKQSTNQSESSGSTTQATTQSTNTIQTTQPSSTTQTSQ